MCNCHPAVHYPLPLFGLQAKVAGASAAIAFTALSSARHGWDENGLTTTKVLLSSPTVALNTSSLPIAICSGIGSWQGTPGAVIRLSVVKELIVHLVNQGQWQFPVDGTLSARSHLVNGDRLYFLSALGRKVN